MKNKFVLKTNKDNDVIYLKFPKKTDRGENLVKKQIKLNDYIHTGSAEIFIDYDENGEVYGIEILL